MQLGEAGFNDALRVRLFSLSLIGTAFSWFSSLAPNSIRNWAQLEHKFHDHFFSGETEAKLLDLTSIKQGRDESSSDYFKRFKEIKNRCFSLTISEKDLADFAFNGVGTPGLGYPILLCLGKSLVVIFDYVQTAGPLRSGALFTRQRSQTRPPAGKGLGAPRVPG